MWNEPAFMNINPAHLSLKVAGRIEGKIDVSLAAVAAGHDLITKSFFDLVGLKLPTIVGEQELLDTGNLAASIKDVPLPIPPNIGTGLFHVPNLGARGTLRVNDKLFARAADNFLTANVDLTNLLVQYTAFGLPIQLNGSYDFGGFGVGWGIFDLKLEAAAGIRQDFTFDPRPLVEFRRVGGETKTIRAGESVIFNAPNESGTLIIIPTIVYDKNTFSDETEVTVDPVLSFNLIKLKGGGRVAGHNLFSFNLDLFGTQRVEDTFGIPLFKDTFALPAPPHFVCPAFRIGPSVAALVHNFGSITRDLSDNADGPDISGRVEGITSPAILNLHIQGKDGSFDQTVNVSAEGFFSVAVPNAYQIGAYHPIIVSGEIADAAHGNLPIDPVTIYWSRPAVPANQFGPVIFDSKIIPNAKLTTYTGTGKFAIPLHSYNVEPAAVLLYDDIPIATTLQTSTDVSDGYLVVGEIPDFLLNRGGTHTLSFLNSGINQKPVLLQNLFVSNAPPTLTEVVKKRSTTDGSPLLFVRGSGFTLDTSLKIGGQPRPVQFVSSTELRVPLLAPDCTAGVHPVSINNPPPGGGDASASYEVAAIAPEMPSLVATHDLLRARPDDNGVMKGDTVADSITLTNVGKNVLSGATITSVKLIIRGKTFDATQVPKSLPVLRPGGYSGVQVLLPPHSSVAGDSGILQVRGTVNGKAFVLSNRVTMPAFEF